MSTSSPDKSAVRRVPGVHAGLDLETIIDAAGRLDPAALTMRGLAAELGVDHKALNHHIRDRDTLMGILAWRAFSRRFADVEVSGDWRVGSRIFANGCVDAAIAVGPLAPHLVLEGRSLSAFIEQSENLIALLLAGGLDDETALRTVVMLTNICLAFAQDVAAAASGRGRPRRDSLRIGLADTTLALPNLTRILAEEIDTYDRAQLDLTLTVFIHGIDGLISDRPHAANQASHPTMRLRPAAVG